MITKDFVLAGKAIFTVSNSQGKHYTYKVLQKNDIYFVFVLTKPDQYTYMGMLSGFYNILHLTKKSKYKTDSLPVKVLNWALKMIWTQQDVPSGYGINHAGRCGRCGRQLTRPEGVDHAGYRYGFGPECWNKRI